MPQWHIFAYVQVFDSPERASYYLKEYGLAAHFDTLITGFNAASVDFYWRKERKRWVSDLEW